MANKKKLKRKATEQAKAGNLSSRLVTRLESAGVKNSVVDRFRNQNQAAIRASSPSAVPSPTPARTTPEAKNLSQGLRIAGGGGGIGRKEFDTIVGLGKDKVEVSPDKVIRRLDKINAKLSEQDKPGIRLKSGAANKLVKQLSKIPKFTPFGRSQFNLGTGRLGMQIQSMLGDQGFSGYMRQGQRVGARDAVDPTYLAQGMDLTPKGKQVLRSIDDKYEVPERLLGDGGEKTKIISKEENPPTTESWTSGPTEEVEPVAPTETVDNSLSSGAGGLDLASWATGFRRAKSSRQRAGKGSQGLGSMKKSPFTSWFK
jgi:hypothetical protein